MSFNLSIDELALDKEWLGQPNLYLNYATKLADSKRRLDEAKNHLEVVTAELDRSIRLNPVEFGIPKITEGAVSSMISIQSVYQAAQKEVIEAKHEVAIHDAAVTAIEHRKKALENLVTLHLAGYYSEPKARQGDKQQMEMADLREHYQKSAIKRKERL
jgi:hypothetical protein